MRLQASFLSFVACALIACTGGPSTTSSGGDEGDSAQGTNGTGSGQSPTGESSSESASNGEPSGDASSSPGPSRSSSGGSSSGGSSSSSSSSSGSGGPRPECVAFANRHCACLEAVSAAAADCRTKTAQGCEDGVDLCPGHIAWYTCSQTTCGNSCPEPEC